MTVFGQHDLGQRAPFPRIDLVLCRNVLIYFTSELQRRALQLFAFSLRDGGYLVLGKSETTSPLRRVLRARAAAAQDLPPPGRARADPGDARPGLGAVDAAASRGSRVARPLAELPGVRREGDRGGRLQRERSENLLLRLPVGRGRGRPPLRHPIDQHRGAAAARASTARPSARTSSTWPRACRPTSCARRSTRRSATPTRRLGRLLEVSLPDGQKRYLRLDRLPGAARRRRLGRWEAASSLVVDATLETQRQVELEEQLRDQVAREARASDQAQRLSEVNQDLLEANQDLSTAYAELRSANEELLVGTEESQAATEEVETLNEELQATNEELETLNEELQATVEELNTTNDDLQSRSIELQELAMSLEDQRRTSEAERARLQAVLASMADAVALVDRSAKPILTNTAFDRTFAGGGCRCWISAASRSPRT